MRVVAKIKNVLLKQLAQSFPAGSLPRKLYNAERLDFYDGYIMNQSDKEKAGLSKKDRDIVLNQYLQKYSEIAKKTIHQANKICEHANLKDDNWEDTINDILFCKFAYGIEVDEYISYGFVNKTEDQRNTFISDRELMFMVYQMNDRVDIQIFNDKSKTYEYFKEYYKRDCVTIKDVHDYRLFCSFVENHPSFVKKKVDEALGRGVELVEIANADKMYDCFQDMIKEGKYLLEEKVIQHSCFAEFNHSSVNTIRLITFYTENGVIVPFGYVKFGRNGSFVDNAGAGGVIAGMNMTTGEIITDGCDEFNNRYKKHPDSQKQIKGFVLPDFSDALTLAKKLSNKTPTVKYIGWDFAYTEKGWIVIEGNGMSQLIGPQSVFQKGLKNEVNSIKQNMKLIKL